MMIDEGIRQCVERPWEQVAGQLVLGTEAFVEEMRVRIGRDKKQAREQPSARMLEKKWSGEELIERVAKILGRDIEGLCGRKGGWERAMVMECLHRYAGESQGTIGKRMGGVDYSWVSRMRGELRHAVERNERVRKLFEKVERNVTRE